MTPGIVPPRGSKHAVKQLHPSADVTFRPARCLLTEPDLALFAVLMESWELALKGGPAWEESWRSAGESLRAERARLRGILNTSSADKKHSLPYCSPPSLRFQSRHFPSVHYMPSPVCQWGCRCVALRDAYYRCRLCVSSVIARPFPTCTLIIGVVLGGLIVFPIKLFFFPAVWIQCGRTLENGAYSVKWTICCHKYSLLLWHGARDEAFTCRSQELNSLSVRNWTGSN